MFLVDSHCHLDQLDLTPYNGEFAKAMAFAAEQGVGYFLCVCITLEDFPKVLQVAEDYPNVSVSVGEHPNEHNGIEIQADKLIELAQHKKVIAIGETGLDYYRSSGDLEWQRERFRNHIRAAKTTRKPLIIHMRQASIDTLGIMREEDAATVGGVMHCFTENWDVAQQALDLGFYISFSGIVTFSNAKEIQEVAKKMPLERMLIETDSPYLAPVPYRGKPNEPGYVRYVAEYIAQLRGVSAVELAERTSENFFRLFSLERLPPSGEGAR
jgi:TatD DNase family protein